MGTTTTRLGLYKPLTDGSELVNVSQDIDAAYDKIDLAVGYQSCTSTTRPSSPYSGKPIYETDTTRTYFSNGSAPASGSWVEIPNALNNVLLPATKQVNIGASGSTASFAAVNALAGTDLISGRVTGDTQSRYLVDTDGSTNWGAGGASATDTNLYRPSANKLKTDDALEVALAFTALSTAAITGLLTATAGVTANGAVTANAGFSATAGVGAILRAYKSASEPLTSSTVLQSDDALTFSVEAAATYLLTGWVEYTQNIATGATGGIVAGFAIPASSTFEWSSHGTAGNTSATTYDTVVATSTGTRTLASNGGVSMSFAPMGRLTTVGAGTLVLQWAQVSSSATTLSVLAGSWLRLERVA